MEQLEKLTDLKNELRVLRNKKVKYQEQLQKKDDFQFKPSKKRLARALHEQILLDSLKNIKKQLE